MKRIEYEVKCPICGGSRTAPLSQKLSTGCGKLIRGYWCADCSPHKEHVIFETEELLSPGIVEQLITREHRKTTRNRLANRKRRTAVTENRRFQAQQDADDLTPLFE